jgi:hypothetical protein
MDKALARITDGGAMWMATRSRLGIEILAGVNKSGPLSLLFAMDFLKAQEDSA